LLISVGIGGGILLLVLGVLYLLVQHEPSFYHRVLPAEQVRKQNAGAFITESGHLWAVVTRQMPQSDSRWHATFTEAQINSFFEEHLKDSGIGGKMLPDNIRSPRVALEQDRVRLACRYGNGPFSTILSAEFRVWMAGKEPNVIVLELQGMHAGALPVAPQPFLEQLSDLIRGPNVDVTWYRHNGHPTAAIQFRGDKDRFGVVLRQLDVRPGVLTIVGRTLEGGAAISAAQGRPGLSPMGN
jgi:hypothetical protein